MKFKRGFAKAMKLKKTSLSAAKLNKLTRAERERSKTSKGEKFDLGYDAIFKKPETPAPEVNYRKLGEN